MKCDRRWWNDGRLEHETNAWCTEREILTLWVIYDHPTDFPDYFVVCKQTVLHGGLIFFDDGMVGFFELENAREWCRQQGLFPVPRAESDDSKIIESWI